MHKTLAKCAQVFEDDRYTILFFEAVSRTFKNNSGNTDRLAVLLKFALLNDLYRTNIYSKVKIVDHITRLSIEDNLDKLLESGNLDAVDKLRSGHGIRTKNGNEYNFYSFATKYCHFSNPKCYPVYDQYVKKAIVNLRHDNYIKFCNIDELHNPRKFRNIIYEIIQKFDLKNYQIADRALWRYGQHLAGEWIIPELSI